jgi:DNA-binding NtrC family response regulator
MPPRGPYKELGRLFDALADPIYVVDDRRRITYVNPACSAWLGVALEELVGRECRYRSDVDAIADPLTAAADALCPPPEATAGRYFISEIALPKGSPNSAGCTSRTVHFLPLGAPNDGTTSVLAWFPADELVASEQEELRRRTSEAQRLHALIAKVRRESAARYSLGKLLGDGPAMRRVRSQITVAAACIAAVSIVGPSGSGRTHAARTIHYLRFAGDEAKQSRAILTPLDAATVGRELLQESIRSLVRSGQTYGIAGTLLVTNVDRLSLDAQSELTGLMRLVELPLRIITTSSMPLLALAKGDRFRSDLAEYLSTLVIEVPPLSARPDDIPLLAQAFLEDCNLAEGRQLGGFTPEALDRLAMHAWPGEARELYDLIAQACASAEGPLVGVESLPQRLALAAAATRYAAPDDDAIVYDDFLADIEKQLIQRAMQRARGNKTMAAKLLGLPRPRLYRRMVQLGLEAGPVIFEEAIEPTDDATPKK